ncbi:MAG TPA: hypothetical protein VF221_02330 [Chloroflexota bacterium]
MSAVLIIVCLITLLAVLDVAAVVWGVDSRDGPESAEWERRRNWKGYR